MNRYDIKRLALILAVQADIDGMKVANIQRESNGQHFMYTEQDFIDASNELRILASKPDEQL